MCLSRQLFLLLFDYFAKKMKEYFYFRKIQPIFHPENDLKYHNFIVFGSPFDTFDESNEKRI